jgi:hypothetical protein
MTPEKRLRKQIEDWPDDMQALLLFLFKLSMSPALQAIVHCDAYAQSLRDVANAIERTYGSKAK